MKIGNFIATTNMSEEGAEAQYGQFSGGNNLKHTLYIDYVTLSVSVVNNYLVPLVLLM